MATYKKPEMRVTISTLMNRTTSLGNEYTYEALKAHKTVEVEEGGNAILIPFHAVKDYSKTVFAEDATKADAYCK